MSTVLNLTETEPLVLRLGSGMKEMTDEAFLELCNLNEEFCIEMNSDGDLVVMSPTGTKTGERNFSLIGQFGAWVEEDGTGLASTHRPCSGFPMARVAHRMWLGYGARAGIN